eukprot:3220537-Pleurochrysis_carterae.AAC.1
MSWNEAKAAAAHSQLQGRDVVAGLRDHIAPSEREGFDAGCPEWLPAYMGGGTSGKVCKAHVTHPVAYKVTHERADAMDAYAEYKLLSTLSHLNIVSLAPPREFV